MLAEIMLFTCMIDKCTDSDGGIFPNVAGIVEMTVTCAAPGGPSRTSTETATDQCVNGAHIEYYCDPISSALSQQMMSCMCAEDGKSCL